MSNRKALSLAFWREISQNLLEGKTTYLKQLSKYRFLEAYEQQTLHYIKVHQYNLEALLFRFLRDMQGNAKLANEQFRYYTYFLALR